MRVCKAHPIAHTATLVILGCLVAPSRASADEKRAKTTDGKEVILRDDGT